MTPDVASVLGSWDCPRSPPRSCPTLVAEQLLSHHRRGLPSRVRRLTRIFSLSPLLFAFVPGMDGDLIALLGEMEFVAVAPHYPSTLSAKQRRLVAVVDRVLKHFDVVALKGSSPSSPPPPPPRASKLKDFLTKFRLLPRRVCRATLADAVADSFLSREILRLVLTEDEDLDGRRVSADDVSDEELTVVVFFVLAVLCRVLLNVEGLAETLELLTRQYSDVGRELCDKGNRVCYLLVGVEEEEARDLHRDHGDLRDLLRAANYYTAAAAACSFDPRLYQNRGTVYFKRGDYDLAFTDALRAHLLNSRSKSANYLMAECLYQMGEIHAARMLNRQSLLEGSREGPPRSHLRGDDDDDAEDNDAAVSRQYNRWRAVERTAKDKLERVLNAASYDYLSRRDPLAAIDAYGRVDDLVEEYGYAALDLLDIDLAVLAYCRSLAYVASGIPYYINCAIEKMERIIENPTIQFPLAFLVLAKAFKELKIYSTARDWAKRGVDTLRRGVVLTGGRHYWPGTRVIMEESRRDKMEEAFLDTLSSCERHLGDDAQRNSPGPAFTFTL